MEKDARVHNEQLSDLLAMWRIRALEETILQLRLDGDDVGIALVLGRHLGEHRARLLGLTLVGVAAREARQRRQVVRRHFEHLVVDLRRELEVARPHRSRLASPNEKNR